MSYRKGRVTEMKKKIILFGEIMAAAAAGFMAAFLFKKKMPDKSADKASKFKTYYNTLNRWLELKQNGVSLDKWFQKNGYKNAAVYGMGELGNRLYEELKDTEIKVEYAIDKNAYGVSLDIPIYQKEDELPDVDVIVVSAVFAFSEISGELEKKCTCPIVSLEDIVFEL